MFARVYFFLLSPLFFSIPPLPKKGIVLLQLIVLMSKLKNRCFAETIDENFHKSALYFLFFIFSFRF